jgi:hypothetical protein
MVIDIPRYTGTIRCNDLGVHSLETTTRLIIKGNWLFLFFVSSTYREN